MLLSEDTRKQYAFLVYFIHDKNYIMPPGHCFWGLVSRRVDFISQNLKVCQGSCCLKSLGDGNRGKFLALFNSQYFFILHNQQKTLIAESFASVSTTRLATYFTRRPKITCEWMSFPRRTPWAESTYRHCLQKWGKLPGSGLFPVRPPINIYLCTFLSEELIRR